MVARRCVVLVLAAMVLLRRWWRRVSLHLGMPLHVPHTRIALSGSWLVIGPLLAWTIATVYLPLVAPFLVLPAKWVVTLGTTLLLGASLLGHAFAHLGMARALGGALPARVWVYPFGDAAQVWPAARTPFREALVALSGPAFNLAVAYAAYQVWDRQLHTYTNVAMPLVAGVNLVVTVLNLAPGFPLDGGRLTRSIVWSMLGRPALGNQWGRWFGYGMIAALSVWGLLVLAERARFSSVVAISTVGAAMILLWALWRQALWHNFPAARRTFSPYSMRGVISGGLLGGLLVLASSLVPTTHGIRMPGVAVPLEAMVNVPAAYRHASAGSFLMTTVVEQTPIVAGQWVYAQLSSGSELVAPERLVPTTTTLQERMHHNYELLEQSEQMATIVALRLAGYHTLVQGTQIEVVNVRPDSWASQALRPGDHILRLNGTPLRDSTDLFAQLSTHDPTTLLDMELVRNSTLLHLRSAFAPELAGSDIPNIVVRAGQPYTAAPFSVSITPQKIIGGPSVGLMFTLTVYDTLTPKDLTGGRRIAGTGTIDLDGRVGPIGGVAQKVAAAEAAGAAYFLVPTANAADARRVARHMQVIEVATVEEAIEALQTLPPGNSRS